MSEKLPKSDFEWCHINKDTIVDYNPDDDVRYIIEVNLTDPEHLHDYLNDYPPAPEPL